MKYNIKTACVCVVTTLAICINNACDNAPYSTLSNQAFFAQTKTNANTAQKITVEDTGNTETTLQVQLSNPAQDDCIFDLVLDNSVLEQYNKTHFTNYKRMPESGYNISHQEIKIAKGESLSPVVNIKVKPFTEEQRKKAEKLALPFKLVSKDGKQNVLNSGGTIIYLLDKVVRQAVPTYNKDGVIKFEMKNDLTLSQWTVEFCVNASKLGKGVGEMNNQHLFGAWGPNGDEIFSRFGDAPIEGNRINIKTQGTQLNSKTQFAENKWYHIAMVCTGSSLNLYVNGVLDNTVNVVGKTTKINKHNIWFGNGTEAYKWLRGDIMISEFRLWNKALSQPQIANNMYAACQDADGLLAYFKFNEGKGNSFTDVRNNGNTAKIEGRGDVKWKQNVRIDGK